MDLGCFEINRPCVFILQDYLRAEPPIGSVKSGIRWHAIEAVSDSLRPRVPNVVWMRASFDLLINVNFHQNDESVPHRFAVLARSILQRDDEIVESGLA